MNVRIHALRGSFILILGGLIGYGASFVRNMILARVLTKADFGIAATLSLLVTLLEFSAKLGVARFVVQDKEGHRPDFIAAAHFVQFLAGTFGAVVMFASAPLFSRLFGVPTLRVTITWLALVAFFRGLEHMDVRRYERELRFAPSALAETVPQVIITLAAWPVATYMKDFRAVLILLIAKTFLSSAVSHWLADRPYRWQWHHEYIVKVLRFAWPLLGTGFLTVVVMQGDQFLVASFYRMGDLGPYAAAAALATAPSFLFGRIFNPVALPILARVQDDVSTFQRRYRQILAVVAGFSAISTVAMVIGGEALMKSVYGGKYAGSGVILAWLACASSYRNLRMAPSLAALAKGDSQNQLISNLWRASSLVPAAGLVLTHKPIWMLACCGLLGEALGCWRSFLRLRRRDNLPLSVSLIPAQWLTLFVASAGVIAWAGAHQWSIFWGLSVASLASVLAGITFATVLSELRHEVTSAWEGFRVGGWREALDRMLGYTRARKAAAF